MLLGGRRGLDARHRVGVHVLAVTESEAAVGALDLEAEHLVERDAGGVYEHENTRAQLPRFAYRGRRRAVRIGQSLREEARRGPLLPELEARATAHEEYIKSR